METIVKEWTGYFASAIEGLSSLIITFAALQASFQLVLFILKRPKPAALAIETEQIRLQFGRWLVLALEFELGVDVLRTAIAPTWQEIGQLAAIATIRTLLNYFLHKEIDRAVIHEPENPLPM